MDGRDLPSASRARLLGIQDPECLVYTNPAMAA